MRALHVLLAGFGFLLGFLIIVVSGLIEWASFASRTDFAFVGDSAVSVGVSNEAIYTADRCSTGGCAVGLAVSCHRDEVRVEPHSWECHSGKRVTRALLLLVRGI